jgi:hypothetical protein
MKMVHNLFARRFGCVDSSKVDIRGLGNGISMVIEFPVASMRLLPYE